MPSATVRPRQNRSSRSNTDRSCINNSPAPLRRGSPGVELIASDACRGLVESVAEYLPEARWQRCVVGP
ncbi:MAG: transposase, partial [Pseudomonadota bacterium]